MCNIFFNFTPKILLMKVSVKYILALSLLLIMFSCSEQKMINNSYSHYIFENHNDNSTNIFKVDSVNGNYAEGELYYVDDNLSMSSKQVSVRCYEDAIEIKELDTDESYFLKIRNVRDNTIKGTFRKQKHSPSQYFTIYPNIYDGYHAYESGRYKEKLFEVKRISDIEYANVKGYWSSVPDDTINVGNILKKGMFDALKKNDLTLKMDIYLPVDDTIKERPLMLFIHGGAFFVGDKANKAYTQWCNYFASLGYVCASINYRMGFKISSEQIQRAAYQATQDAHAALRYILSKENEYGIDEELLFVVGSSAGSIIGLNLAYMCNEDRPESSYGRTLKRDLGNLESSGNEIEEEFMIKALANMWGAVFDLDMMQNDNVSIISFHGDKDGMVPYGYGYPFESIGKLKKVLFDKMYGSREIHKEAQRLGMRSVLHTFEGQGHALHLNKDRKINDNFYVIQNEMRDFFFDELIKKPVKIIRSDTNDDYFTINTEEVLCNNWSIEGGVILDESMNSVEVFWFDDEVVCELKVSGYYKNGAYFEDVFIKR